MLVTGHLLGVRTAQIAFATPSIMIAVAVEKLVPASNDWYPDSKVAVHFGAEIVDEKKRPRTFYSLA